MELTRRAETDRTGMLAEVRQLTDVERLLSTGGAVLVSSERGLFTPEMAADIIKNCQYEKQRALDQDSVALYKHIILTGRWLSLEPLTLGRVRGELKWNVLNGQHRCHSVAETKTSVEWGIQRFEFETPELMDYAYSQMDGHRRRGFKDTLPASGLLEKTQLPEYLLRKINSASRLIAADFQHIQTTRHRADYTLSQQHQMTLAWAAEGTKAHTILDGKAKQMSRLDTQPVLAVMLVTLRYQFVVGSTWWRVLAVSDELKRGTPAYLLTEYLTNKKRQIGGPRHIARVVAYYWSAEFEGVKRPLAEPENRIDPAEPIVIAGTPYKGEATDA